MARFKPVLFFAIVAALALFLVYHKPSSKIVNVGDPAPDFAIKDEAGKELKLSDLRGNVVFLNFWGTTCEPCRLEMPDMELMNQTFKDRKFKMVAISYDTEWDNVKKFYEEHKLTLPTYIDPGRRISARYNVYKFPETYLIDGNGTVLKHTIGMARWADPKILSSIDSMIKKEETPGSAS
jgi:peroxiredoxin